MQAKGMVLVVLAILLLAGGATALKVNAADAAGAEGSTVKLDLMFAGAVNVGSMDLILAYDAGVAKATGVEVGPLAKNAYLEYNIERPGGVRVAIADSNGIAGDGAVLTVSFLLTGSMGSQSGVSIREATVHSLELVEIGTQTEDGTLKVSAGPEPTRAGEGLVVPTIATGAFFAGLLLFQWRHRRSG
ncbi:MAG: cohesin domain-containing protein [Methanomicrobiales archaeon]|nr:cohesin domain-containing protein [Methanomicrobiales archaeon]